MVEDSVRGWPIVKFFLTLLRSFGKVETFDDFHDKMQHHDEQDGVSNFFCHGLSNGFCTYRTKSWIIVTRSYDKGEVWDWMWLSPMDDQSTSAKLDNFSEDMMSAIIHALWSSWITCATRDNVWLTRKILCSMRAKWQFPWRLPVRCRLTEGRGSVLNPWLGSWRWMDWSVRFRSNPSKTWTVSDTREVHNRCHEPRDIVEGADCSCVIKKRVRGRIRWKSTSRTRRMMDHHSSHHRLYHCHHHHHLWKSDSESRETELRWLLCLYSGSARVTSIYKRSATFVYDASRRTRRDYRPEDIRTCSSRLTRIDTSEFEGERHGCPSDNRRTTLRRLLSCSDFCSSRLECIFFCVEVVVRRKTRWRLSFFHRFVRSNFALEHLGPYFSSSCQRNGSLTMLWYDCDT